MVSFASGGMVDDDLIAALKSDVKKKKFVGGYQPGPRTARREIQAQEKLAGELEEILANAEIKMMMVFCEVMIQEEVQRR